MLYRDTLDDTIQDLRVVVSHFKTRVLVKGDSEHAAMKAMERIIWLVASTQRTTDDRVPRLQRELQGDFEDACQWMRGVARTNEGYDN